MATGPRGRIDVARAAPVASVRVARIQVPMPPGCCRAIGIIHTATDAAPATTVMTRRPHRRVEPTMARMVRMAKAWTIDCRKPASSPRATIAPTPCQLPGRARQARMIRREPATASND